MVLFAQRAILDSNRAEEAVIMGTGGLAMVKLGGHAVVLGAGLGGLLAARVLADFYDTVTVVERDVLPERSANRHRGSPGPPRPSVAGPRLKCLG
jgi:hypothetical protein